MNEELQAKMCSERDAIMPYLGNKVFIDRIQQYVCSSSDSDLVKSIATKFKECVLPCNITASLLDFSTVGNLPLKSSLLTTGIQGIIKLLIEGFFRQKQKEIALPLDPEFTYQMIRFNITLYDHVKMLYFAIPPFHFMKHAIESSQKSIMFLSLILEPFINSAKTLKSKFKGFDIKLKNYVIKRCAKQNITIKTDQLQAVIDMLQSRSPTTDDHKTTGEELCDVDENGDDEDEEKDYEEESANLFPYESAGDDGNINFGGNSSDNVSFTLEQESSNDSGGGFSAEKLDTLVLIVLRDIRGIVDKRVRRKRKAKNLDDEDDDKEAKVDDYDDSSFLNQINMTPKRIMYLYRLLYYAFPKNDNNSNDS
jgi:hypothetical protein